MPALSGGLVVSDIEHPTDHSPADNIDTARTTERVGCDYALTHVRYVAAYGAAVHPGQWPPHILAKLAATAQSTSGNRLALRTGLIGTPEQVADRIAEYKKVGIDLVLTGFLRVREEVERFSREVIPLVRERERDLPLDQRTEGLEAARA